MKAGAFKVAKKILKAEKAVRLDPFDVVSRARSEHHVDVVLHHHDVELLERVGDRRLYFFDTNIRSQQLPLLMVEAKSRPGPQAVHYGEAVTPGIYDTSVNVGGVFPAYLTSMLVMFVQAATRPEPQHLLAFEGRLDRLERVVLAAAVPVEEKPQIDWERLEAALPTAAESLNWQVEWSIDREKSEIVGRVTGMNYSQLARQKLDFYEHVAAAVDKETFKAVSFELEAAE